MAYSADPTLWLYTSLTAGSSHIITATSRLETILKANKIPFRALDVATDEKARMLWGRRSKGRKLPGLVKYGSVIGDIDEIEEWNEYGELKEQIVAADAGFAPAVLDNATTAVPPKPETIPESNKTPETRSRSASDARHISITEPGDSHDTPKREDSPLTLAMRQAGAEAAAKAGQKKTVRPTPITTDKDPDATETTAHAIVEPKLQKSSEDAGVATEITAAKIPAQLASEGAKRTSVDKISGAEETAPASSLNAVPETTADEPTSTPSKEEQVLQMQRASSVTKTKSRLSSQVEPADVKEAESTEAIDTSSGHVGDTEPAPRSHQGSSISAASKEEIEAVEKRNAIPEEPEEADDDEEAVVGDETRTQKQDPKNAEAAGVSVGD